ncbi:hypothetical protein DV515_00014612 [Chloebia gouldiae]|uniref:Uncharacterized protein n=1 Tax=Chloebia gouldiae TaxID=44316 RepID=A0A3L8RXL4_CHLGU|nr:hypothetical protein DV515_00014612 [Chloebia gouldiae]
MGFIPDFLFFVEAGPRATRDIPKRGQGCSRQRQEAALARSHFPAVSTARYGARPDDCWTLGRILLDMEPSQGRIPGPGIQIFHNICSQQVKFLTEPGGRLSSRNVEIS